MGLAWYTTSGYDATAVHVSLLSELCFDVDTLVGGDLATP